MAHAGSGRVAAQQLLDGIHVLTGDLEAHHELCEQLLEEYSDSTDATGEQLVGMICLNNPKIDPEQIRTVTEMVSRAWKTSASNTLSQREHRWFTIVRAMAEYRRKDHQKANEALESCFRFDGTVGEIASSWIAPSILRNCLRLIGGAINDVLSRTLLLGVVMQLTASSPQLKASDGTTLLMYAALHGDAEGVRILLDAGADPNAVNEYGQSALIDEVTIQPLAQLCL